MVPMLPAAMRALLKIELKRIGRIWLCENICAEHAATPIKDNDKKTTRETKERDNGKWRRTNPIDRSRTMD
jgi:hypothetical protein